MGRRHAVPTTEEETGTGQHAHPRHPDSGCSSSSSSKSSRIADGQRSTFCNAIFANVVVFLIMGLWITCSSSPYFDDLTIFNGKQQIKLFDSGRLFTSFLPSPTAKIDLQILEETQTLYDGSFVADPDYWKATCFEDGKHNQVRTSCPYPLKDLGLPMLCNRTLLLLKEEEENDDGQQQRLQRSEGVSPWQLTRWQPSSLEGKESLKLFNPNTTVALLKEMGIKRINIIGDSMSRYFGFVLGGLMADVDLPQLAYGGDFNFIGEECVGIQFYFYWRTTIPAMRELMQSYAHPPTHQNGSTLVILNNNAHQINFNETSFWGPDFRFEEVSTIMAGAQAKWGERRVFWRTPNQMVADFRAQVPERTKEEAAAPPQTYKGLTRGEMIDLDRLHTAPRIAQEFRIPMIDAFRMTDAAGPVEAFDGQHYSNWEVYHEVNVWLNQLERLYRGGWWNGGGAG